MNKERRSENLKASKGTDPGYFIERRIMGHTLFRYTRTGNGVTRHRMGEGKLIDLLRALPQRASLVVDRYRLTVAAAVKIERAFEHLVVTNVEPGLAAVLRRVVGASLVRRRSKDGEEIVACFSSQRSLRRAMDVFSSLGKLKRRADRKLSSDVLGSIVCGRRFDYNLFRLLVVYCDFPETAARKSVREYMRSRTDSNLVVARLLIGEGRCS